MTGLVGTALVVGDGVEGTEVGEEVGAIVGAEVGDGATVGLGVEDEVGALVGGTVVEGEVDACTSCPFEQEYIDGL